MEVVYKYILIRSLGTWDATFNLVDALPFTRK